MISSRTVWLALRVGLATAAVLTLAYFYARDAVTAMAPALRWGLEQAAPEFKVLRFGLVNDRGHSNLAAQVQWVQTLILDGRAVVPEGTPVMVVGSTLGNVLQPLLVAAVLLLAWPLGSWREALARWSLAVPLVALALMLDTPLSMAAWLWFAQLQVHAPQLSSPLIWWNTWLGAGGRLALGLLAAGLAIVLAQRLSAKAERAD